MATAKTLSEKVLADPIFAPYTRYLNGIIKRQASVKKLVDRVVRKQTQKCAILVGPPGLGKSYVVQKSLDDASLVQMTDYFIIKGHITPVKLFAALYMFRAKGQIVVLDDCDNIFKNEIGVNILKAATDTTNCTVSYETNNEIRIGGVIVKDYVFHGTIIICTNVDMAGGRGRQAEHLRAIDSRSVKVQLNIETREKKFAQLLNVVLNTDYLKSDLGSQLSESQVIDMLKFIQRNLKDIKSLDLRLPTKVAAEMLAGPDWEEVCELFIAA